MNEFLIAVGILGVSMFVFLFITNIVYPKTYIYFNDWDETRSRETDNLNECKEIYIRDCIKGEISKEEFKNSNKDGRNPYDYENRYQMCNINVIRNNTNIGFYWYSKQDNQFYYTKYDNSLPARMRKIERSTYFENYTLIEIN